jgi:hypothetical protein
MILPPQHISLFGDGKYLPLLANLPTKLALSGKERLPSHRRIKNVFGLDYHCFVTASTSVDAERVFVANLHSISVGGDGSAAGAGDDASG